MVSAAGAEEVPIVINMRDEVTASAKKVGQSMTNLGGILRRFAVPLTGVITGLTGLRSIMILAAASFAALPAIATAVGLIQFGQATRRAQIQLQLLGLTSDLARERVDGFSRALDRNTSVSILRNVEAVSQMLDLGPDLSLSLATLAEDLNKLTGIDPATAFTAFAEALTQGDFSKLKVLFGDFDDLAEAQSKLEEGDIRGFFEALADAIAGLDPENVSKLSLAMRELAEQSRPFRELVTEAIAGFTAIGIIALTKRVAEIKEDARLLVAFGLAGALFGNVFQSAFASGFRAGLVGVLVAILVTDIGETTDALKNDPDLLIPIVALAALVGTAFGNRMLSTITLILGLELAPGLTEVFGDLETSDQLALAATGLGFVIGRKMIAGPKGFLSGLAAAFTVQTIITELRAANFEQALFTALLVAGAVVVAAALGATMGTILIVAFLAVLSADFLIKADQWFIDRVTEFEGIIFRFFRQVFVNAFTAVVQLWVGFLKGIVRWTVSIPDMVDAIIEWFKAVVRGAKGGVTSAFKSLFDFIPSGIGSPFDFFPGVFQQGGIVPGQLGTGQLIMAHAGERIVPVGNPGNTGFGGQGGGTIIIPVSIGTQLIGEIAIDAVRREARFKGQLNPGNVSAR